MANTWVRTVQASLPWGPWAKQLANLSPGETLLRTRFGWGFTATTSATTGVNDCATNLQVLGICSVTSGTQPPNARTQAGDFFPPTERWLWWDVRAPQVKTYDSAGDTIVWEQSPTTEQLDSRGQVAANVGTGNTLGIWASWAPAGPWDASGAAYVWVWASMLIGSTVG